MAVDKDAWIFGLSVYMVTLVFNFRFLWEQASFIPLFTILLSFAIPAGIGYFIGQLKHKKVAKLKHLILGACLAYVLSHNLIKIIDGNGGWFFSIVVLLLTSAIVGWRLPMMFKQSDS